MAQSALDRTGKPDIDKVRSLSKPEVITLKIGEFPRNGTPPIQLQAGGLEHAASGYSHPW